MAVATKRQSGPLRDSQRQRLYDAERAWWKATVRLESVREMQAFVDHVAGTQWWQKRTRCHEVTVTDGRRRRRGNCAVRWGWARIAMPRHTRHVGYLVHELAHAMPTFGQAAHGPMFVTNYLMLVKRFMGRDEFEALFACFREANVEWAGSVA